MYALQQLLTHKDPKMIARYAHLRDEALKRASGVADEILESIMDVKKESKVVNLEDKKK